jgi:hypothetical protein
VAAFAIAGSVAVWPVVVGVAVAAELQVVLLPVSRQQSLRTRLLVQAVTGEEVVGVGLGNVTVDLGGRVGGMIGAASSPSSIAS